MSVCSQHLSILNPRVVVPVQSLELELNCSPTVDRSLTARLVTYRVLTQTRFVCLPDYVFAYRTITASLPVTLATSI